jgi:1-acyl-sn-glycerol-3-phosphate acyltransferase
VIRKALFLPVATASTLFFSLVAVVGGLVRAPKGLFDWIHRNWARSVLGAAGVRIEAKGLEHVHEGRAYVFVSNHQSFFDVWTMMATLPASIRFVAKQELARIPIFAAACRAAGHVFIDRRDAVAAGEAIRVAGQQMEKEGLSLFFFPEGTRSADGKLRRFKKGSFALAIETQLELVAVAIDGGAKVQPKGARLPNAGTVRLRCAPAISMRGMTGEQRDLLTRDTRETVAGMLEELKALPADAGPGNRA